MIFKLMAEAQRDKIAKDLLSTRPKGEKGEKPVYTNESYYCYEAYKDKNRVRCNHKAWGYKDETLWDLGFRVRGDVEEYIRKTFYNGEMQYLLSQGQKAGTTRKSNRLWGRIQGAIGRFRSSGTVRGTYSVSLDWSTEFHFFGDSIAEIESLASTMLKPIFPDAWKRGSPDVTFVEKGDPSDILESNQKTLDRISSDIQRLREDAEKNVKKALDKEQRVEYARDLIMQNFENAMHAN